MTRPAVRLASVSVTVPVAPRANMISAVFFSVVLYGPQLMEKILGYSALETGAAVLPVAVHNTEQARRGWRIRPRKVKIRAGRPMTFPPGFELPA